MSRRDEELNRLVKYAEGMGISVKFKPYKRGSSDAGGWLIDGSEIVIYVSSDDTKVYRILSLIHELGHHRGWLLNNKIIDPRVELALSDDDATKTARKRIYLDEVADTRHWEQIYKDTNCCFDIRKLYAAKDFDIWCYERYYEDGSFPSWKEKNSKLKELRIKYKKVAVHG